VGWVCRRCSCENSFRTARCRVCGAGVGISRILPEMLATIRDRSRASRFDLYRYSAAELVAGRVERVGRSARVCTALILLCVVAVSGAAVVNNETYTFDIAKEKLLQSGICLRQSADTFRQSMERQILQADMLLSAKSSGVQQRINEIGCRLSEDAAAGADVSNKIVMAEEMIELTTRRFNERIDRINYAIDTAWGQQLADRITGRVHASGESLQALRSWIESLIH